MDKKHKIYNFLNFIHSGDLQHSIAVGYKNQKQNKNIDKKLDGTNMRKKFQEKKSLLKWQWS